MTLEEAIETFLTSKRDAIRSIWALRIPEDADGACYEVSSAFVRFLNRNGWDLSERNLVKYTGQTARHHPLQPEFISEQQLQEMDDCERPCGLWAAHWVVAVGKKRIDWTARQFDETCDFPLVWETKRSVR